MENLGEALFEKYSFLARYVSAGYRLYLCPISMDDIYGLRPDDGAYSRCPKVVRIYLLGKDGEEVGKVGERPYTVPAVTLFGWTIVPERTYIEHIGEYVGPAIKRIEEPIHWVLVVSEKGVAWGYRATLYCPPRGETINEWYARETKMRDEAFQQERQRKEQQIEREATEKLAGQRRKLQAITKDIM